MNIQELYPKLENIYVIARQIVEGFLSGLHQSPHHGYSVEFAEHRSYTDGDSLRHIDWKVFGRTDKMYVKKYEEETNVRTYLLLDRSDSMYYKGAAIWNKLEYACLLMASMGYLTQKQLDGLSWGIFSDQLEQISPPKTGQRNLHEFILQLEQLIQRPASGKKTNLVQSLQHLKDRIPQRSLIYIFSDFLISDVELSSLLTIIQEWKFLKHEVVLVAMYDVATEISLDFEAGTYSFQDVETGHVLDINIHQHQAQYAERMKKHLKSLEQHAIDLNFDWFLFDIQSAPEEILKNYLMNRTKMM